MSRPASIDSRLALALYQDNLMSGDARAAIADARDVIGGLEDRCSALEAALRRTNQLVVPLGIGACAALNASDRKEIREVQVANRALLSNSPRADPAGEALALRAALRRISVTLNDSNVSTREQDWRVGRCIEIADNALSPVASVAGHMPGPLAAEGK